MDIVKVWHIDQIMSRAVKALEKHDFQAASFKTREALIAETMRFVRPGMIVGAGGSMTLRELGLFDRLRDNDVRLLDHWKEGLTKEEVSEMRIQHMTCNLFLTSANAITEKGEIVNMDGMGNRINSMTFGPDQVIIIAGYNKIVPDIDSAIERIKRIAAPMNAKRLQLLLPCAETGYCHDCQSDLRICRLLSIMLRRPGNTKISIFLLGEELGF